MRTRVTWRLTQGRLMQGMILSMNPLIMLDISRGPKKKYRLLNVVNATRTSRRDDTGTLMRLRVTSAKDGRRENVRGFAGSNPRELGISSGEIYFAPLATLKASKLVFASPVDIASNGASIGFVVREVEGKTRPYLILLAADGSIARELDCSSFVY